MYAFKVWGNNGTVSTKNIWEVYLWALNIMKCQMWFYKFICGNFDTSNLFRFGKSNDNEKLGVEVNLS